MMRCMCVTEPPPYGGLRWVVWQECLSSWEGRCCVSREHLLKYTDCESAYKAKELPTQPKHNDKADKRSATLRKFILRLTAMRAFVGTRAYFLAALFALGQCHSKSPFLFTVNQSCELALQLLMTRLETRRASQLAQLAAMRPVRPGPYGSRHGLFDMGERDVYRFWTQYSPDL